MEYTHNLDNTYWIVLTHEEGQVRVYFEVFPIVGTNSDGLIFFQKAGSTFHPDLIESIEGAERTLKGSVKWDGCSDITFYPDDEGYNHFCGMTHAVTIGKLLEFIYRESAKLLGVEDDDDLYY